MHWPPGYASESMMCALISSRPSSKTWNRPTGPAPTMTASVSIGPSWLAAVLLISSFNCGSIVRSLHQLFELVFLVGPFVGVGQRGFALGDARPLLGQLGVELNEVLLIAGHVFFRHDRVDRAFRNAHRAIDA